MAESDASTPERRVHVRFPAHELSGLRGARVKYGESISVIDLSAGGVLFETAGTLSHEATIVLEFSGPTQSVLIPSRVVRVHNLRSTGYTLRSQSACAFKRPLGLKDLVTGSPAIDRPARAARDAGPVSSWQPIIGKCRDGRLISGFTSDFSPAKSYLHISPARSATERQFIELTELEAIFFLRETDDLSVADRAHERVSPYGRKVALVLPNGEQMTGSTLNYSRHSSGVFVYPFDSDFGVARVFVTQSGLRNLRLL
jgi:hypothetical protein